MVHHCEAFSVSLSLKEFSVHLSERCYAGSRKCYKFLLTDFNNLLVHLITLCYLSCSQVSSFFQLLGLNNYTVIYLLMNLSKYLPQPRKCKSGWRCKVRRKTRMNSAFYLLIVLYLFTNIICYLSYLLFCTQHCKLGICKVSLSCQKTHLSCWADEWIF